MRAVEQQHSNIHGDGLYRIKSYDIQLVGNLRIFTKIDYCDLDSEWSNRKRLVHNISH
jgi:hypothetical protein